MRYLPVILLLLSLQVNGQKKDSAVTHLDKDTATSYFDVNAGIGDDYFTARPIAVNSAVKKLYYSAEVGYYHKSGLSLSLKSFFIKDKNTTTVYQTSITPSYEYDRNKHFGFGVYYTHYFNNDSVSFYQSPLINEYHAYVTLKNDIIEPSLSYTYGSGKQKVKVLNQQRIVSVSDYSFTLSAEHCFDSLISHSKNDLSFTPEISLSAGTSEYGFNNSQAKGKGQLKKIASQQTKKFELQSLSLLLPLEFKIHSFYIEPSVTLDYYLPGGGSFSSLEMLLVGFSF